MSFSRPQILKSMNRGMVHLWRRVYTPLFRHAAHQVLKGRLLDLNDPKKGRWLDSDIKKFLNQTWGRTNSLMPIAGLEELPTYGNRHNVFLAVVTTAAFQVLLESEMSADYANTLVADMGWKIYYWMLKLISFPFRLTIRDPVRRMEKVLAVLMKFPFSASAAPGYEVNVWTEGDKTFTHWIHCPPQAMIRRLIDIFGDRGELNAFYHSWCLFDWPGADIIADDGRHGHYTRQQTMSKGDSICDMCWQGYPTTMKR